MYVVNALFNWTTHESLKVGILSYMFAFPILVQVQVYLILIAHTYLQIKKNRLVENNQNRVVRKPKRKPWGF